MNAAQMIGRRVREPWSGVLGTVVAWEPLGAGMCDGLVEREDGSHCWHGSGSLRPVDGLGPLPSRADAQEQARHEALASLQVIRSQLVEQVRSGRRWPGCDFGKAHVGQAIDAASAELKRERLADVDARMTAINRDFHRQLAAVLRQA